MVIPTLALMNDQLQLIKKHNISVIAFTLDIIAANPRVSK